MTLEEMQEHVKIYLTSKKKVLSGKKCQLHVEEILIVIKENDTQTVVDFIW